MLSLERRAAIFYLVESSLDSAEETWGKVDGDHVFSLEEAHADSITADHAILKKAEVVPSKIPGYEFVSDEGATSDDFIALVADMRASSKHLRDDISTKIAKVSQLKRVYYETSALLPALAKTIQFENGSVTEYLGDGVLALFKVDTDETSKAMYAANRAAENCVGATLEIVNQSLAKRYWLPPLEIGVGLAMSKVLVSLVGLVGEKQPKAIGSCVYKASKLAGGRNQVHIDDRLYEVWPTSKTGVLSFSSAVVRGVNGFLVSRGK